MPEALGQRTLSLILVVTPDEDTLQNSSILGYAQVAFWLGVADNIWGVCGDSCLLTALRARSAGMLVNSSQSYLTFVLDEGDWPTYFFVLIDTLRRMTVRYAGSFLRGWN